MCTTYLCYVVWHVYFACLPSLSILEAEVDSTISSVVHGPTRDIQSIPLATSIPAPSLEATAAAPPRHVSRQSHVTPSYSSDEGSGSSEDTRLCNISTEMQALMTTIRQSLSSSRKSKAHRKRPSSSIVKRVPGEALRVMLLEFSKSQKTLLCIGTWKIKCMLFTLQGSPLPKKGKGSTAPA